ncbi:MAG TPA: CDP-alcohol phosphatidyltransferase family protein [Trueperaceae bacterium]|nr:CDP-alcohol phosphatidyltransferase family protein [Trueperaceae bacterium]
MIDQVLRKPKEKYFAPLAKRMSKFNPNILSLIAFGVGLLAILCILIKAFYLALILWLFNRLLDGLDGEVARTHNKQTDWGGYLDIMLDFIIYALIPISLVYQNPNINNYLALSLLLASFYLNSGSWMYLSALLEKRNHKDSKNYTSINMPCGLIEGLETIIFYSIFIIFHNYLNILFLIMSALMLFTIAQRFTWAYRNLRKM